MLTFYLFLFISCNALYFCLYIAIQFICFLQLCLYITILFISRNSLYMSQFYFCVYALQFCLYLDYVYTITIQFFCVYSSQLSFISHNSVYTLQFYFCVYILVEYPVSCLNISDGKSCSVLTLLGRQLLHV